MPIVTLVNCRLCNMECGMLQHPSAIRICHCIGVRVQLPCAARVRPQTASDPVLGPQLEGGLLVCFYIRGK